MSSLTTVAAVLTMEAILALIKQMEVTLLGLKQVRN